LDLEGYSIEILSLSNKDCSAIVLPKVSEMVLNRFFEFFCDVLAFTERLVPYTPNESKPFVEMFFLIVV
jgi:hypothetical protein